MRVSAANFPATLFFVASMVHDATGKIVDYEPERRDLSRRKSRRAVSRLAKAKARCTRSEGAWIMYRIEIKKKKKTEEGGKYQAREMRLRNDLLRMRYVAI